MHVLIIAIDRRVDTTFYYYLTDIAEVGRLVLKLLDWGYMPEGRDDYKYYKVIESKEPVFSEV
jgi:hypothetical protein